MTVRAMLKWTLSDVQYISVSLFYSKFFGLSYTNIVKNLQTLLL